VQDTVPPVLTLPSNITAAATSANGALIGFSATATDAADGTDPVICTPSSGTLFAVGTTTVRCVVSDNAGNRTSGSFTVTVVGAPVLTVTARNLSRAFGSLNPTFTYSVTGFVNGDTASVLTGVPSFTTTAVGTSPQGTYPITITQGTLAAANYTFQFVNGALIVLGHNAQTITFLQPPDLPLAIGTITLSARSTSTLSVVYTVSGPATISKNKVTFTGTGSVTITASQPGNATFDPAIPVSRTFTVTP
jgi:hypothetical protein